MNLLCLIMNWLEMKLNYMYVICVELIANCVEYDLLSLLVLLLES
jgi:hypothetical protein